MDRASCKVERDCQCHAELAIKKLVIATDALGQVIDLKQEGHAKDVNTEKEEIAVAAVVHRDDYLVASL